MHLRKFLGIIAALGVSTKVFSLEEPVPKFVPELQPKTIDWLKCYILYKTSNNLLFKLPVTEIQNIDGGILMKMGTLIAKQDLIITTATLRDPFNRVVGDEQIVSQRLNPEDQLKMNWSVVLK